MNNATDLIETAEYCVEGDRLFIRRTDESGGIEAHELVRTEEGEGGGQATGKHPGWCVNEVDEKVGDRNVDGAVDHRRHRSYDEKGRLIEYSTDHAADDNINGKSVYMYNDSDKLISEEKHHGWDVSLVAVFNTTYTYDASGYIQKVESVPTEAGADDETLNYRWNATWSDDYETVTIEMDQGNDGSIDQRITATFSPDLAKQPHPVNFSAHDTVFGLENAPLERRVDSDADGEVDQVTEYSYDDQGRLQHQLREGGWTVYSYDAQNRLIREDYGYGSEIDLDSIAFHKIFEYDTHGNVIKEERFDSDGVLDRRYTLSYGCWE